MFKATTEVAHGGTTQGAAGQPCFQQETLAEGVERWLRTLRTCGGHARRR
eukprot:m.31247 g.31247  ORF g.31247 m.31247 type:complete len:50 (+) comp9699_c0_seq1:109-258(+)